MPLVIPQIIKSGGVAVYGNIVGMSKLRFILPMLQTIDLASTKMSFKEKVMVGDSDMLSETVSRAETVLITNV